MGRKMKDSGIEWIGEIPEDWKACRLRYLCNISTGDQDTQDRNPDGRYPFYVRSPIVEKSNKYTFDGEAILMAGDGVGAGRIFHLVDGKYGCHQRVYSLQNIKNIYRNFLYYFLQNRFHISIETANSKSTVDSVRLNMLQDFIVLLPNMEEQYKIAYFIDYKLNKIESTINKTRTSIEEYKKLKQSIITQAVTKGIRPNRKMKDSGIEWIGEIPKGWNIRKIKYISSLVTDGAHISPETDNGVYDFVSTVNINNGEIDFFTCLKTSEDSYKYLVSNGCKPIVGDVLISKDGTVGKTAMVMEDRNFVVASSLVIIRPKKDKITSKFLNYALQSKTIQEGLQLLMRGAGLKRVSVAKNANLTIVLPSLEEQSEIADYLDTKMGKINNLISKKEQLLTELENYKKSLIFEYVTGKKEVSVA